MPRNWIKLGRCLGLHPSLHRILVPTSPIRHGNNTVGSETRTTDALQQTMSIVNNTTLYRVGRIPQ
ncbi:hypothetical protein M3J09_004111 [Ascochyta lentis]